MTTTLILIGLSAGALVAAHRARNDARDALAEAGRLRGEAVVLREEALGRLAAAEALIHHVADEVDELIDAQLDDGLDLTAFDPRAN